MGGGDRWARGKRKAKQEQQRLTEKDKFNWWPGGKEKKKHARKWRTNLPTKPRRDKDARIAHVRDAGWPGRLGGCRSPTAPPQAASLARLRLIYNT